MQEDLLPVGAVFFFLCVSEVNSLYILLVRHISEYSPTILGRLKKSCTRYKHPIDANVSGTANNRCMSGVISRLISERAVVACETERPSDPCTFATTA